MCCRSTPNIRATYLAHQRVAAYLMVKPTAPMGMKKVKQDLCIKLLATGQRQYQAGMMLHQRPYQILKPDQVGVEKKVEDKLWVGHICKNYDSITGGAEIADEVSTGGSASEHSDSDGDGGDDDAGSFKMGSASEDESGSGGSGGEGAEEGTGPRRKAAGKKGGKGDKGKSKRGKGKAADGPQGKGKEAGGPKGKSKEADGPAGKGKDAGSQPGKGAGKKAAAKGDA